MLCCGLLALVAATAVGVWRWLRAFPRTMLVAMGATLLAAPVLALAASESSTPISRADLIGRAMQTLCGAR
ncbi:hypothetical protein BH10PSE12_BH10PSE12_04300 [soil metagenome]